MNDEFDAIVDALFYDDEEWTTEYGQEGSYLLEENDTIQDRIRQQWAWN